VPRPKFGGQEFNVAIFDYKWMQQDLMKRVRNAGRAERKKKTLPFEGSASSGGEKMRRFSALANSVLITQLSVTQLSALSTLNFFFYSLRYEKHRIIDERNCNESSASETTPKFFARQLFCRSVRPHGRPPASWRRRP
jgi:hypothetical protein